MDWDTYGFVKASNYRSSVMIALSETPKTPSDLSEELDLRLSHVSNTLTELSEKGLVECLTENRSKGRIYATTDDGDEIVSYLTE